ncbi:hypothetical protein FB45DRAFT_783332 [Roridomyces roridus]|uniref:MYND-type domain-containing protein n=1 Tax=Roridomyces roridus TaxID=1738132 RepID=A0AAD7FU82_9AGAR|nr:hypothetical protein FB45DRAFT_783332 [Roridomyces roridus]
MAPHSHSDKPHRQVHLPLNKLEKCDTCSATTTLRICAACGERTYCSLECQKKDWPSHKLKCGKTDRINIDTFYPLLAAFADIAHLRNEKPQHPAFSRSIINSPNPGSPVCGFPDGSGANLVMLGDPIDPSEMGTPTWWPTALSDKVRSKLMRRILREGYALSIATSICLSLLAEMYTTTAVPASDSPDGKLKRRTRLTYKSSPIADFGVATGSANVKNQDKLAYFDVSDPDLTFRSGQDPNDHYWIYFTTIRGEDVLLDCSMFTFNMCLCVDTEQYVPKHRGIPPTSWAPAFFRERMMDHYTPDLYTERKRMSVLRNTGLHTAVAASQDGYCDHDAAYVQTFMEALAGRPMAEIEVDLAMICAASSGAILESVLQTRSWTGWPEQPPIAIEADPGEVIKEDQGENPEDDEEWFKFMRKHTLKHKRPGADKEALGRAFRKWEARNAEKKKKDDN